MSSSVFKEVWTREVSGYTGRNISLAKRLPESCIEYFECRNSQAFHLHTMLDTMAPPFACDFSPIIPDLLLIAQEDGLVHLYNTDDIGPRAFVQDYEAHANAVFDVKWLPSGLAFLTASGDQSIRLIDAEAGIIEQQFFGHMMSVRSLALMPSDPHIFASASRDGSIRLWDIRVKSDTVNYRGTPGTSSVGLLSQCHLPNWSATAESGSPTTRRQRVGNRKSSSDAQSVTSVVFMNGSTLLSSGSTDGSIKMWDLRKVFSSGSTKKAKPKCVLPYRGISQKRSGYSDLQLDSLRTRLYANCLDNVVYEYDLTRPSTSPIFAYTGHQTDSFYIKLDVSVDDNYLICGSSDKLAYIYTIGQQRQRPILLSGHNGEVSVPRWSRTDPTRIVTLSDDSRAFVWNMFPARRNMLPQPGELAGLAERISPSKCLMSPSEQSKRILRSPRSTPRPSSQPLDVPASPSLISTRRRQSNIRCFLEAISPPASSNQSSQPCQAVAQRARTRATDATLPQTLGGVVQRFPGFTTGAQTSTTGTPPAGCYTPIKSASNLLGTADRSFSDHSDIENISPSHRLPDLFSSGLPLDHADSPSFLTQSPIISSQMGRVTNENRPHALQNRMPLALQQPLLETPPQSSRFMAYSPSSHNRKRSSPSPDSNRPSNNPSPMDSSQPVFIKRRRLTVCTTNETFNSSPAPPGTPTPSRRRRMTTMNLRLCRPITSFFKPDDL